jgi:nucleotide-binding universal stress UspA family protein
MHSLLCLIDIPSASASLTFGREIIHATQSRVTLLAIRPPGEPQSVGQKILAEAAAAIETQPSNQILRHGGYVEESLTQINIGQYDLVILDANEQIPREGIVISPAVQRIIAQSETSILVVRGHCRDVMHIMVATAGNQFSDPTVYAGARLARATSAQVTLLHVTSTYPGMYTGMTRLDESLSNLLQSDTPVAKHLKSSAELFSSLGINAHIELRHGLPEDEILSAVETGRFDLLVIGKTSQGIINRLFMTDISHKIVEHAPCPILIVSKTLGKTRPRVPSQNDSKS